MSDDSSRRDFVRTLVTAAASGSTVAAQSPGRVRGLDHVAIPMRDADAMVKFYKGLGLETTENANAVSVHIGEQMINFHRPTR